MIEYNEDDALEYYKEWEKDFMEELLARLDAIGIRCRDEAVLNGNYKDRSKNLRNSIDYAITIDGEIVRGGSKNPDFVREVAEKKGLCFILTAGMEYASYVEFGHYSKTKEGLKQTKPYNVIASAELLAEKLIDELIEEYKEYYEE